MTVFGQAQAGVAEGRILTSVPDAQSADPRLGLIEVFILGTRSTSDGACPVYRIGALECDLNEADI